MSESAEQVSLSQALAEQYDAQLENDPARQEETEIVTDDVQDEPNLEVVSDEISEETIDTPEEVVAKTAPQHWPEARQELFNQASPEIQDVWLEREAEVDRGFKEKGDQIQTIQSTLDRYETVIAPLRQQLQLQGQDEFAWLGQMAAYTTALQNDPVGVIKAVATQYGVDLGNLKQSDEFTDPAMAASQREIQALKQQLSQLEQSQVSSAEQAAVQQITAFRDEKDASGNLVHPHFEAVSQDITRLAQGYKAANEPMPSLSDLYERAVLMNPHLTQEEKAEAERQAEQDRLAEQAARARRAKSGAARPKGSADVGEVKHRTLKEELNANFDNQIRS